LRQRAFDIRDDAVGELAGALEAALALGDVQLAARLVEPLLQLLGAGQDLLLGLPAGVQLLRTGVQLGDLGIELGQALLGGRVGFLPERALLDLELDQLAVELVDLLRLP
jgi:hypothetical protein